MVSGFCDLNICIPHQYFNPSCLDQLTSLGYKTVAVNTVVEEETSENTGAKKKKAKAKEFIPAPNVSFSKEGLDRKIQILQRLTIYFSDASQLQKLCKSDNAKKYDIISVVPKTFTAFQLSCACKDVDLISFDASEQPIMMNRKSYNVAISNGIFFEVPYAPAISDSGKRKNTIQIGHLYHIYGKSKNVIITSGATNIIKIRSPYDVVNLGLLFGLSEEQAKYSMSNMSRALILRAESRRFGKTAMTVMITDLQLDSEEESEDSEPTAKRSKPATESDSEICDFSDNEGNCNSSFHHKDPK